MAQHFARVVAGLVAEIIPLPDGVDPASVFSPELLATLETATPDVTVGWTLAGGVLVAPDAPPASAPSKADLTAYAAQKRWQVETGGIVVSGAQIDTSRESQSMIANAFAYVQAIGAASVEYKTASGWVTMDAPTVKAVALAVGAHVQACFAAEQAVDAAISAGTITTTAQIDSAAWPA